MPATSAELKVNAEPGCPSTDPLCGFTQGMNVLIFDDTGSYDTFTVTQVQDPAVKLQHNMDDMNKQYTAGAKISQVITHTYYLKKDTVNLANPNDQLMLYDGAATETPVIDHLVALQFDYYGEPSPPQLRKPVSDPVGPWTTYGPKPPSLGVQNGNWPLGENCVFQKDPVSGMQVPRARSFARSRRRALRSWRHRAGRQPLSSGPRDPIRGLAAEPESWPVATSCIYQLTCSLRCLPCLQ
jgi:hypothetical protein